MKNILSSLHRFARRHRALLISLLAGALLFLLIVGIGAAFLHKDAPEPAVQTPETAISAPDTRLQQAQARNTDTLAWLTIPGTTIDCSVQQAGNNDFYLRRDAEGNEDVHGCIFADYECDLSDAGSISRNIVLYGHTFSNSDYDGGFEPLQQYRVFEFGQENPYIYLTLSDAMLTYQIFSVGVCEADTDYDCILADPADAEFKTILDKAKDRCAFDYGVDVGTDDYILTLSTCTGDDGYRLLVVGKLVETFPLEG